LSQAAWASPVKETVEKLLVVLFDFFFVLDARQTLQDITHTVFEVGFNHHLQLLHVSFVFKEVCVELVFLIIVKFFMNLIENVLL
jgi:hypothetical protein